MVVSEKGVVRFGKQFVLHVAQFADQSVSRLLDSYRQIRRQAVFHERACISRVLPNIRVVSRRIDVRCLLNELFHCDVAERATEAELFVERHHFRLTGKIEGANGVISALLRILDGLQLESRRHSMPPPFAGHPGEAVHYALWNRFEVNEIREAYEFVSVFRDETSIGQHILSSKPVYDGLEGNWYEWLTLRIVLLYYIEELVQVVQSRISIPLALFGESRDSDAARCYIFGYARESRKIRGR